VRIRIKELDMSPSEAITRINEAVTVEMLVQRTKCCTGSKQVFLDSEVIGRRGQARSTLRIAQCVADRM
jgi:hypothetical protein